MTHSNCYLEAMGIPNWQCQMNAPSNLPNLILVDPSCANHSEYTLTHPIVVSVLGLLSLTSVDCKLTTSIKVPGHYVWDMRSDAHRATSTVSAQGLQPDMIVSASLDMLEKTSNLKRQLWMQVVHVLNKKDGYDL